MPSHRSITLNPEATRAFVAHSARQSPATFRAYEQYCAANGHDSGQISRVRWATLYSTVAMAFGAGGVPNLAANRLYSQPLGGTDAVMGVLTDRETNLSAANKMPNGQSFLVRAHGFDLYPHTLGAASTAILTTQAMAEIVEGLTCRLLTGSETTQIWGPITAHMMGTWAIQALPLAGQTAGPPQGNSARVGVDVDPGLALEPGMSFSVEVAARALPATVANNAGLVLGIRHWFIGQTRTAIDG